MTPKLVELNKRIYSVKAVPSTTKTQVWQIKINRDDQRGIARSLDITRVINIWRQNRNTMDVMVEGSYAAKVANILQNRDVQFSIAVPDLGLLLDKEQGIQTVAGRRYKVRRVSEKMDWKNYYSLNVIYDFMEELRQTFPYLCSVEVIGTTYEKREIKMIKISNGCDDNEGVWVDGGIHAREWISTSVAAYIADYIARNYNKLPESCRNKDWYIVPVLNPDGYDYTFTIDRMWRKNRMPYGPSFGVDLNRNFGHKWGHKGEDGSSADPQSIFYRGPEPFSENESTAVKNVIENSETKFTVFLSLHSYGEVILFPWGYTRDPCSSYINLLRGGSIMAKAIFDKSKQTYKVGSTRDLMYYAAGTSIDWAFGDAHIPFSYMIELRGNVHKFMLPREEILATAQEAMYAVIALLNFTSEIAMSNLRESLPEKEKTSGGTKKLRIDSPKNRKAESSKSSRPTTPSTVEITDVTTKENKTSKD